MTLRPHALRQAFCVYRGEKGATTRQIVAMAGHMALGEVELYSRAADRAKMVKFPVEKA